MPSNPGSSLESCPRCGASAAEHVRAGFCSRCLAIVSLAENEPAPVAEEELAAVLPSTAFDSRPQTRFGDYELLEEIARGGMGVVYRARQRSLNRVVAVKTLLFAGLSGPDNLSRFRREAATASSLEHPNIVRILDVGEHNGQPFLAMDYVAGKDLGKLVMDGPLPAREAVRYVEKIARAVEFAHQRGVLHRDLKPSNVLIDGFDEPRLTDFGLARHWEGDSELSRTGQTIGSPGFLPPEQAAGDLRRVGPASDVYGLGAILYHLLTGRPPFLAETFEATIRQVMDREPIPPRQFAPGVPADLETVCLKCLEKEPAKRYATAQELADELGRFLEGEPIHARPVSRVEKAWRWCRRKPALAAALLSILLLLLVVSIGSPLAAYRINRERVRAVMEGQRAEAEALAARRNLYAANMVLAQQSLAENHYDGAIGLLNKQRPARFIRPENDTSDRGPLSTLNRAGSNRLPESMGPDPRGWEWRYLWGQCQSDELTTLGRHQSYISTLDVSPNGWTIAAGSRSQLTVWDWESRRLLTTLTNGVFQRVAFSPDGKWLAAGGDEGLIDFRDTTTWTSKFTITNGFWFQSLHFSPDGKLLIAGSVSTHQGWDVTTRRKVLEARVVDHTRLLTEGVGFSPGGDRLALDKGDGGVAIFDLRTRTELTNLVGAHLPLTSIAFSPDGRSLVSGSLDGQLRVWQTADWALVTNLTAHVHGVESLAFSPDGRRLASGGSDSMIRLWDALTWQEVATLKGHHKTVSGVKFSPDGQGLVSVGGDGAIKLWSTTPKRVPAALRRLPADVRSDFHTLGLSADARTAITTFTNRTFSVWDIDALEEPPRYRTPVTNLHSAAISAGGRWVAFGTGDGRLVLWERPTQKLIPVATLPGCSIYRIGFSPNGAVLVAAYQEGTSNVIRVWQTADQTEQWVLLAQPEKNVQVTGFALDDVTGFGFSPDQRTLFTGHFYGAVRAWDLASGRAGTRFSGHPVQVRGLCVTPDGRRLITAGGDTVKLWDIATGREEAELPSRSGELQHCALSPDGRRLAVGTYEEQFKIWDMDSRQELLTLSGHHERVVAVAFSPDGNTLTSLSADALCVRRAPSFAETDGGREAK